MNKINPIVFGIVLGCLITLFVCMIGFIICEDYIRAGMILGAFIAMYFLLKPIIKNTIKLKKKD